MKNVLSVLVLVIAAGLLTSYSFIEATWTAPTSTPPGGNVTAPINIGSTTQTKLGNLLAPILGATTEVRSDRYCDSLGANCIDLAAQGGDPEKLRTQVQDWPDSIICNETNGVTNVYRGGYLPYNNGYAYYYGPAGSTYKIYRLDGTFYTENWAGNCTGKSITQLAQEGKALSYGVEDFVPGTNMGIWIVGGHALSYELQTDGVPGFRSWNVSGVYHGTAEREWVCNYFLPGSRPVWSSTHSYSSPGDNGMHYLTASGTWAWGGASARNVMIMSLYCR